MQIRDTHFLTHRDTGKLKGVFVEFSSKDGLQTALQMNGTVSTVSTPPPHAIAVDHKAALHSVVQSVMGRALRIDIAEARPERSRGERERAVPPVCDVAVYCCCHGVAAARLYGHSYHTGLRV